jgi:hypothetical protein
MLMSGIGCAVCMDDYYKENNMCLKCKAECLKCIDGEKCSECKSGYFMKEFGECKDVNSVVGCHNDVTDLGCDEQLFKRVVKTTFNQRRKMLRVSLRQIFDANHPASPSFFEDEMMTRRPEQLSIQEFIELTNKVSTELG